MKHKYESTVKDKRGHSVCRWSWRLGEVEKVNEEFVARIYYNFAITDEDADKEATDIFAVVKGKTEEQCDARAHRLFNICCQGEFDDYYPD